MTETPNVVVRKSRSAAPVQKNFAFSAEMIPQSASAFQAAYRQAAWEQFQKLPVPETSMEPWRRTDLRGLQADTFRFPQNGAQQHASLPAELMEPLADERPAGQVILLPGEAKVELEEAIRKQGVIFTDLRTAGEKHPELLEKILGQVVKPEEGKFAALAGAFADNGVVLYVPRNVNVEKPLHSILWGPGSAVAHASHLLVWLEEGASVTYVHEAASPSEKDGQALHAGIVEIHVGPNARLRFVELQSWGEHVWNFSHERAKVEQDGTLEWIFGAVGSHLTKNFSDLDLVGRGATGKMSGFYFTDHDQHLDHDTQQNHLAPSTTSDLLFKGALVEESRSVWQGMIYVAPGAAKTDGYQANRNLVLSSKARADSIPGLEILADDVRCTHGATVGKLDEEQVFYLLSRGIPRAEAERLIVEGFFDPIMQRIPFEGVRRRFQDAIHLKMASYKGN